MLLASLASFFSLLTEATSRLSPTTGAWLATLGLSLLYPVLLTLALVVTVLATLSLATPWGWLTRIALALPTAIALALITFKIAALLVPTQPSPRPEGAFRIAHLNTLLHTPVSPEKLRFITQSDADVISLVEVNSQLAAQLPSFKAYPYQIDSTALYHPKHPENRIYPTALLSRWPIERLANWTDRLNLYRIQTPRGPIHILQIHPYAPISETMRRGRDHLLHTMLKHPLPGPLIVIGDYNTTPWDPALIPFTTAGLTFQGPILPTFHRSLPVIPIDLVYTKGLPTPVIRRVQVPTTDHFGLTVDITL